MALNGAIGLRGIVLIREPALRQRFDLKGVCLCAVSRRAAEAFCNPEYAAIVMRNLVKSGLAMAGEFDSMFSDLQASRAAEAAKRRQADEQAVENAKSGFNTKAQCLRDVVLPVLQEAKESFARQGLLLEIDPNVESGADAIYRDPDIKFFFKKPDRSTSALRLNENVSYFFVVTHTQGGVQCGRRSHRSFGGNESENLSADYGIGVADQLTREKVVAFVKFALADSTR